MYYEEIARVVTGLGVTCVGTLAAQEGQFGDVIQPESGGLSPSDTGNRSLRAGGGARSHPSSRGGAGGGRVLLSPVCSFRLWGTAPALLNPRSVLTPPGSTPRLPQKVCPFGVPREGSHGHRGPHLGQGWHVVCASVSWGQGGGGAPEARPEKGAGGTLGARPGQGSGCLGHRAPVPALGRDTWTCSQMGCI